MHSHLKPKFLFNQPDGREGVFHIAGAGILVDGGDVFAEDGVKFGNEFVEGDPFVAGDVHCDAVFVELFCGGQDVGVHYIGDECEVPALGAVSVDYGLTVFHEGFYKFRDHGRVLRSGVLIGTEHIEVSQGDGFESVETVEDPHVVLTGKL